MPEAHVNPLPAIAVLNGNQLVPIADSPDNVLERDVVGNKTDTVAGNSAISLLKQIEGTGFNTGTDSLKVLSDMLDTVRTELTFQQQTDAVKVQMNPASGTLYTVLDTTLNVRIISMVAHVTWTAQPSPLEFVVTIDGQVWSFAIDNPASGIAYEAYLRCQMESDHALGALFLYTSRAFLLEGRSVKIQVRTTGGDLSGVPDNVGGRVKWAKR